MRKVKRYLSLLLSLALLATCIVLPTGIPAFADGNDYEKRIVGYFLAEDRSPTAISTVGLSLADNIEMIDYASLTHLNVSFMGPADTTSAVPEWKISDMTDEQVHRIIELCHENNVKCILSVGGGANSGYKFFESTQRRDSFYNQMLTYLDEYGFDGIDMDIESTTDKEQYSALLAELSAALKSRGKTLSMAVAPYIIEGLSTNVSYFDFFNVMTYDANGSGASNVAPYDWMISQLGSYAYQSIPKEKMTVGLPFYGYSTDGRAAWNCDYDYAKVVQMCLSEGNTDFLTQDAINFPGSYNVTNGQNFKVEFNSRATIMKKVEYVSNNDYGGIMIWDVTKDCLREEDKQYALLGAAASMLKYPSSYDAPTNLVASDLTEESVHLEWDAPTTYNPSGYNVYYGTTKLGTITTTNTCCVINDLSAGFEYEFKVTAIDPDGVDTAPATLKVTAPGEPSVPSNIPEWNAGAFYSSGSQVLYNGQVWTASWGGSGETPTGTAGNMWKLDSSITVTPTKNPVLAECEEHGVPTAPTIKTESLADGKVDYSYNKSLTARGTKPITWSIVAGSLPAGLGLDTTTGAITGTPTTEGTYTFTVKATNDIGSDTKELSIVIKAKPVIPEGGNAPGTSKRVIGYIPWWRAEESKQLDFEKLDYVILAFLRYTSEGWDFGGLNNTTPWSDSDMRTLISNAHAAGCKVLLSVGGGDGGFIQSSLPFWYENSREYLANCILEVVDEYGFDGVDMDAETDDVKFWQGYNEFVDLMRVGLDARDLEMSMAVHTWFTDLIENEEELYAKYDFLNVMCYDNQYNRDGEKIGIGEVDHAPMWHAYQLLDHYTELGVPADKLNVGVPFYYYRESLGWDGAVSYAFTKDGSGLDGVTIDTLPGESKTDAWKRTIQQKAYLGGTEYGGAFIWELGQDTFNNQSESLLTMVYDCVNGKAPSTPLDEADRVYPELAPINGTDLPLTPVNRDSVQPDFPALGGGSTGGSIGTGSDAGTFSWSTNYAVGDYVTYNGYVYQCIKAGYAQVQPQGAGYDNDQWKYIGTSIPSGGNTGSSEPADDGDRVLIDPYWWMSAGVGETLSVTAAEDVTWSVRAIDGASPAKSDIISVDANGTVTALAEGCAVIDAKVGSTRVASLNVQVLGGAATEVEAESVTVTPETATLEIGATTTATATVAPENATNKTVTWSSSDDTIATVDANGVITAIAEGEATITATTANGLTDTCVVTVNAAATADKIYTVFKVNQVRAYNSYFGAFDADAETIIVNKRAFVPLRYSSMLLGASVEYDAATREVMLSFDSFKAKLTIDSTDISFYKLDDTLVFSSTIEAEDQVPIIVNKSTYLPARVLGQIANMAGNTRIEYVNDETSGQYVVYILGSEEPTQAELQSMIQTANQYI